MAVHTCLCLFFVLIMLLRQSQGYKFHVGGKDGWVLNPSESYNHWAERNRFQVNDTLFFKFKKGNDSVLVVTKENYNQCNVKNPIRSLTEGESELKFERSGPHYFNSGNQDHCKKGQKLVIVVLAVRPKTSPSTYTPAPAPTPSRSTSTASPPAPSALPPAPVTSAPTPSPSTADGPASSTDKSFAMSLSTTAPSAVLSVAIGVGAFMGCFGFRV